MPNDARLGLVVGVGVVIAVAVLFFRKETPYGTVNGEPAPAGIVRPFPMPTSSSAAGQSVPARATAWTTEPASSTAASQRHTVQPGDTLFTLARRYYGDAERFGLIYNANRSVLSAPDPLPVGAELIIPKPTALVQNP
jgi:nucleoid-associated protein YgaU